MRKTKLGKKIISLAICVVMVFALLPVMPLQASAAVFSDTDGHWAEKVINMCNDYGIINGYEGSARPDDPVSVAEFCAMTNRAFGYVATEGALEFTDVLDSAWYAKDIKIASAMGYLQGHGDGTVGPETIISRERVFTMLSRIYRLDEDPAEKTGFTDDSNISSWARGALAAMTDAGYINGNDNKIMPKEPLKRGELAQALSNLFGEIIDEDIYSAKEFKNLTVRKGDITISNATVNGDFYVTAGVNSLTMKNVAVNGRVILEGANLIAENSKIKAIIVVDSPLSLAKKFGLLDTEVEKAILNNTTEISGSGAIHVIYNHAEGVSISEGINVDPNKIATDKGKKLTIGGKTYIGNGIKSIPVDDENSGNGDDGTAGGSPTVQYTVSFDTSGGTIIESQYIFAGNLAAKPPANPTKSGYAFVGWYNDPVGGSEFNFDWPINGNTTVYARWSAYTITPSASNIAYGQSLASSTIMPTTATLIVGGATIPGAWAWDENTIMPAAGTHTYAATYTPSDTAYAPTKHNVSVIVDKKVITAINGITGVNKVYNGLTTADVNVSAATSPDTLSGDYFAITGGAGTFADKNVGTGKTVAVTQGSIALDTETAQNYQLGPTITFNAATANITPKAITDITGLTFTGKEYDGTTAGTTTGTGIGSASAVLAGVITGDTVGVTATTAAYADKNAGTGKNVAFSGFTLTGADAGNYSVTPTSVTLAAGTITKKTINTINGITGVNKVYDGQTTAAVNVSAATSPDIISGDNFAITGGTGTFANKNGGTGKAITCTQGSVALDSGTAQNYQLGTTITFGVVTANITAKAITDITGLTFTGKEYDGTTAGTTNGTGIDSASAVLTGVITGDTVGVTATTAVYADKNAGTGKNVIFSGFTLTGAEAGNYSVTPTSVTLAAGTITRKAITINDSLISILGQKKLIFNPLIDVDGTTYRTVKIQNSALLGTDTLAAGDFKVKNAAGEATAAALSWSSNAFTVKAIYDTAATGETDLTFSVDSTNYTSPEITVDMKFTDGTETNPIVVNQNNITAFNAYAKSAAGLGLFYIQEEDIVLAAPTEGGSNWDPIGRGVGTTEFTGKYDGNFKTITGMTINKPGTDSVGMFGVTLFGGVYNLGLLDVDITGNQFVGGIAGESIGHFFVSPSFIDTVRNCYVTGSVKGSYLVGGIAGRSNGTARILNCYSEAVVESQAGTVGGITGSITGSKVENCYSAGEVKGMRTNATAISGGIAGSSNKDIINCFSTASVYSGKDNVGGIVGKYYGGTDGIVKRCVALNSDKFTCLNPTEVGAVIGWHDGGAFEEIFSIPGCTALDAGKNGTEVTLAATQVQSWWSGTANFAFGTTDAAPWKWDTTLLHPVLYWQ